MPIRKEGVISKTTFRGICTFFSSLVSCSFMYSFDKSLQQHSCCVLNGKEQTVRVGKKRKRERGRAK